MSAEEEAAEEEEKEAEAAQENEDTAQENKAEEEKPVEKKENKGKPDWYDWEVDYPADYVDDLIDSMVMRGVIEEKNNRIIEVIVSSVKPIQLMIGKIVGVALVALTQFFIWILLTGIIVAAVMGVAGADTITNAVQSQAAVQQATAAAAQAGESMPSISSIFGMLGGMHIGGVLISFLIYFVLGYLLYSSMMVPVS